MGVRSVGIDLTRWISRGALLNLTGFSLEIEGIIRADSTQKYIPLVGIDGVATDVPYGRASSTKGKETSKIIHDFINSIEESFRPPSQGRQRFCVIMHPSTIGIENDGNSFQLEERHLLYVHRNLTRAISVLKSTSH